MFGGPELRALSVLVVDDNKFKRTVVENLCRGLEFVHFLRNDPASPNPYMPIIMLTGHGDRDRVREARDAGVNTFMAKPISAKAMYERLVWMINHPLPFLRTNDYFGPDRRRNDIGPPSGVRERRAEDIDMMGKYRLIRYRCLTTLRPQNCVNYERSRYRT
jgi:CheY-like chemotaxis protein